MNRSVGIVAACGLMLVGAGAASADEPWGSQELRDEMRTLQSRMAVLEAKEREAQSSSRFVPPTGQQLISGVDISGFADVSYTYSLQEPDTITNTQRGFDTQSNGFLVNNVQLNLVKEATEGSRVGFSTSLMYGTDAEVVGGVTAGLGSGANELEIYEAYVQILADIGNGLDIKIGKYGTLAGAELVPSMDNWNFTRSFIWLLAEPLTHTGVRMTYAWSEMLETTFGVNNGWDNVDDNNKQKSIELGLGLTPSENTSVYFTYLFGAEASAHPRHLFTAAAGWDVTDQFSLALAYDLGWEEAASSEPNANAHWDGVAVYGRYQFNDWYALAGRWEWFRDRDGVRTGLNTADPGSSDVSLWEFTITNEFNIYEDVIARLEYRHDRADGHYFSNDGARSSTQDTVSMEVIYPF